MDEYEDEFALMDYLNVIWKRKWLIVIPTLFLVIAVGIISFLLPKKWEIDAIIQPSKFLFQTEAGQFNEIVVVNPSQIAGQINQESYNHLIAIQLNLDIREFPKLKAENLKNTNLVRVSTKEKDTEKAKLILFSLFNHLKGQLDEKVDIEIKGVDSDIKSKEIDMLRIKGEIKGNKNKFDIVKQRKKDIEREMNDIRKRIEALEKEQQLSLKRENRSESESLAMLLYSNEIQQSLEYHNTLIMLTKIKK